MDLNSHTALSKAEIQHVQSITNTGELYYDYDPLIEKARNYAFYICRKFNQNPTGQKQLLVDLLGEVGQNVVINPGFITEFGFNTHIEDDVVIGDDLKMIDCNVVKIGKHATIGNQVGIYTSNHALDPQKRADHWCSEKPIIIANNVVIEDDVCILGGVTIGENTIVKQGSIVIHDLPANTIAQGVPCEVVQKMCKN